MPKIDWKSLVPVATKSLLTVLLTIIATKWADASDTVHKIMNGDTVPLYGGAINLSFDQLQLWGSALIIAAGSAILGWIKRVQLKREANIALALPKNATKSDVKSVSEASPMLSEHPDWQALRDKQSSIRN